MHLHCFSPLVITIEIYVDLSILREKEELKKIKEREAARAAEAAKPAADLNATYEKPSSAKPSNKALDRTVNMDQQQPQSYDMTPARHELPPEPLRDEDNYGECRIKGLLKFEKDAKTRAPLCT